MKGITNNEITLKAENFARKYSSDDYDFMRQRRAYRAGMLEAIKILNVEKNARPKEGEIKP